MPHNPRRFSDRQLLAHALKHSTNERNETLIVLVDLGEIDRRRLYLELGYSSLFDYCTRDLGYSNSAAYRRIKTARCLRRFPEFYELIEKNEVNLTTVSLIAPALNDGNRRELIEQIRYKTQREVETIMAAYRPPGAFRDRVRSVQVAVAPAPAPAPAPGLASPADSSARSSARSSGACERSNYCRSGSDIVLTGAAAAEDTCRIERKLLIQFLANPAFMRKYDEARSLLSNRLPRASFEDVFEALIDEFVERHSPKRRKARRERLKTQRDESKARPDKLKTQRDKHKAREKATTEKPRPQASELSRRIPTAVRDEVFLRDKGRCTYVGARGKRCDSRNHLHVDHIKPFARGGPHTATNLRLLCSQHNMLEAERSYGAERMKQFRRRHRG